MAIFQIIHEDGHSLIIEGTLETVNKYLQDYASKCTVTLINPGTSGHGVPGVDF